ncbi:hypothetical protein [Paenibacillus apiarius]|uniref:Uncharacterized protein n=2 Tax=Paenibacillus apiarius TaxID=46240 RepID=A0ABT4DND9_9BACL|nr:hypothetical protein [Paenibacillus apiarius]MCY9514766.1 hypothetical protein [Paenibacillus apiarius]MCY9518756.1 hypothetical protein [Paenibacillus apiarius]MCY9552803.1 hypothetical protein [Paenibacillus apiarius]MCY9556828.1 hypothetical protein [Paenibacillus apiarius]MCY9686219.1 hypothetical protein [Paenibacillus apiarius]
MSEGMIHQTLNYIRRVQRRGTLLALLLLLFTAACSKAPDQNEMISQEKPVPTPKITIKIDGGSYIPNLSEHISLEWKSGMTVTEALKQSGSVKLAEDHLSIASVGDVSLDTKMGWGILLNDEELRKPESMENSMQPNDSIVVFVKRHDVKTNSAPSPGFTLRIDGGKTVPEITNSYAVSWQEQMKVSDLIGEFALIELSPDGTDVTIIGNHKLDSSVTVNIKVNDTPMQLDKGLEQILQPDDRVELNISP